MNANQLAAALERRPWVRPLVRRITVLAGQALAQPGAVFVGVSASDAWERLLTTLLKIDYLCRMPPCVIRGLAGSTKLGGQQWMN